MVGVGGRGPDLTVSGSRVLFFTFYVATWETWREKASFHWLTPQLPTKAGSYEPRTHPPLEGRGRRTYLPLHMLPS